MLELAALTVLLLLVWGAAVLALLTLKGLLWLVLLPVRLVIYAVIVPLLVLLKAVAGGVAFLVFAPLVWIIHRIAREPAATRA